MEESAGLAGDTEGLSPTLVSIWLSSQSGFAHFFAANVAWPTGLLARRQG